MSRLIINQHVNPNRFEDFHDIYSIYDLFQEKAESIIKSQTNHAESSAFLQWYLFMQLINITMFTVQV